MEQRKLGPFTCSAISMGCMNVSHAYGTPPPEEESGKLLNAALDMGYTMLDTAALYGFGANESLIGKYLKTRRDEYTLASKCGMFKNEKGERTIDGRPETIKKTCEDALKRLNTDVIDLYYLHRCDKNVPIEESVGAMGELVKEGKVQTLGLSEIGADHLRRAHAEHAITALQTEYSLWTRNPEIAVLDACKELGVTFVAFSPLARGFLCGDLRDVSTFEEKDIRRAMPRFSAENYPKNLALLDQVAEVAKEEGVTLTQLALAWVLGVDKSIIAIPGTRTLPHLEENFSAGDVTLSEAAFTKLQDIMNQDTVVGPRYPAGAQKDVYTEDFA